MPFFAYYIFNFDTCQKINVQEGFWKISKKSENAKNTIIEPTQLCFGKTELKIEIFFQSRKKHFIFFSVLDISGF